MSDSPLKPLAALEDHSPVEIAAALRSQPGFAFFDSARETGTGADISIVAASPRLRVSGSLWCEADVCALQAARLRVQRSSDGADRALPRAILAGTIDYEGGFNFALYDSPLVFEHASQRWFGSPDAAFTQRVERADSFSPDMHRANDRTAPVWQSPTSAENFCQQVVRAQEYIRSGDIYQVNLSHRIHSEYAAHNLWSLYESLRHYSPAPYAAFLKQPARTILSSSPELFLKISGRSIQTRPIKGTRPRRNDPLADERSAYDLLTSTKEISELVMITDLERSDLGQICEWGSVSVRDLLKLERHEQVFHLVSTVEGRLRPEVDPVRALQACFPGGSITGAPKKRAREIIAEIESTPRGLYTGAIGWFGSDGESRFSIAIRTLIHEANQLHFHVGAGIVADSIPTQEWQETWDKAAGIMLAAERMEWDADGHPAAPPSAPR
jgi:para-aminobenzoate synthetase component 1